ncbi:MAG TPA: class A beta-lactamase-related serine hydrolase [Gammaproteobacteria bacterium]|nr:hypothetical protein [Gammaproteobacteria bacterium]HIG60062.1 class A beta-lactamase-related serine hydrolase [Gammaproteobacteria bacterium]HIK70436.1 class A beta-lactamase-related serine hydrolase [Pseudomonadales bacterium]
MRKKLQQFQNTLLAQGAPGTIIEIGSGSRPPLYHAANGVFSRTTQRPLTEFDGFRIASMSKTFTAVLAMQLAEQGHIGLDASVSDFIDLSAMPMFADAVTSDVSIRHLLTHQSGLWDFAMSRAWSDKLMKTPRVFRPPQQTLDWAFTHGHSQSKPGDSYLYSDTGYVALGLLIERVTGLAWGDLVRRYILTPLNMSDTWLEGYESPRSTLSHTYAGSYDGLQIHGSADWAAGGHVSTTSDLARFMRGLFTNQLFSGQKTLADMLTGATRADGSTYGCGLYCRQSGSVTLIGHSGFWGSDMAWVPQWNLSIASTVNHTGEDHASMLDAIVLVLQQQSGAR